MITVIQNKFDVVLFMYERGAAQARNTSIRATISDKPTAYTTHLLQATTAAMPTK